MLDYSEVSSLNQTEVLLIGFESVGKSGLFRELTGEKSALARNVKGSTTAALEAFCKLNPHIQLTDLPGLQLDIDSKNTQLTLDHFQEEKTILLVVKATNLKEEVTDLYEELDLKGRKVAIIATHSDKHLPTQAEQKRVRELLQVLLSGSMQER